MGLLDCDHDPVSAVAGLLLHPEEAAAILGLDRSKIYE